MNEYITTRYGPEYIGVLHGEQSGRYVRFFIYLGHEEIAYATISLGNGTLVYIDHYDE